MVQEALGKICQGKTAINIAHRLSTIRFCNPIYVISEKVIAEQGSFDELVNKGGIFYKLTQDT